MKEQDVDPLGPEEPDSEPGHTPASVPPADREHPPEPESSPEPGSSPELGSSLERGAQEALYVKKGSERRRPKYGTFGFLGGMCGLITGLILAQVGTIAPEENYTRIDLSIVLVGLGVPAGIFLALLIALFLDRRSR